MSAQASNFEELNSVTIENSSSTRNFDGCKDLVFLPQLWNLQETVDYLVRLQTPLSTHGKAEATAKHLVEKAV